MLKNKIVSQILIFAFGIVTDIIDSFGSSYTIHYNAARDDLDYI